MEQHLQILIEEEEMEVEFYVYSEQNMEKGVG